MQEYNISICTSNIITVLIILLGVECFSSYVNRVIHMGFLKVLSKEVTVLSSAQYSWMDDGEV